MIKLLANENFPRASVWLLRSLHYDIVAVGEDFPGISDQAIMEKATSEQRLILTFDRDYGELIFKHQLKPEKGVLYLRLDTFLPEEPRQMVHQLLAIQKVATDRRLTVFDGVSIRQRKY